MVERGSLPKPLEDYGLRVNSHYITTPMADQGMSFFVKNIQTCRLRFFIVSLGALINHKKFQGDSNEDYNRKQGQKLNILEKTISDGPSANLRPLFNSNVTKVSIIKWSQN